MQNIASHTYGASPYAPVPSAPGQYASGQFGTPQYGPGAPQYATPQHTPPQYTPGSYPYAAPGPGEPFDGAAHPADLSRPLYGASLPQAFVRFFKNYAVFSGRASRSEYWWMTFVFIGSWIATGTIVGVIEELSYSFSSGSFGAFRLLGMLLGIAVAIAYLGSIIPILAVTWRRLHDANLPGPLALIMFFPFLGSLALIVMLALPPRPEGRRFIAFG